MDRIVLWSFHVVLRRRSSIWRYKTARTEGLKPMLDTAAAAAASGLDMEPDAAAAAATSATETLGHREYARVPNKNLGSHSQENHPWKHDVIAVTVAMLRSAFVRARSEEGASSRPGPVPITNSELTSTLILTLTVQDSSI